MKEKATQMNKLRLFIIATLAILTVQGWTGDYVNLFSPFPQAPSISPPTAYFKPYRKRDKSLFITRSKGSYSWLFH
jgi:hypothetical protein